MTKQPDTTTRRHLSAPSLIAFVTATLIVSAAGTAERVVLGEYFTNLA